MHSELLHVKNSRHFLQVIAKSDMEKLFESSGEKVQIRHRTFVRE